MANATFINDLGLIVVSAAVFAFLARRISMPSIVAYLLAGLMLGPLTGLVGMSGSLELISEIGIALLLFLVGLELSLGKIKDVGRVAVVAGMGQVVVTAVGGVALCWLMGFGWTEAIFIAIGITFSSSVLAVKLLDEKKELDSLYGHIAVGCSLVQSFLVIIVLSIISGLGGGADGSEKPVLLGLTLTFGGLLLLVAVVMAVSHYLLARLFKLAANLADTLVVWSLCWCFSVIIAATFLGLSMEIGAFLAGVSLAQLPYNADLHRRVHPMMNFFLAIFFVSLGVQMNLDILSIGWVPPLALSLFVIIGNTLIYLVLIPRLGYSAETALLTGITGAQISEFSFILAATGVSLGMVGQESMSLMSLIGLITMSVSAYMIRYNHEIVRFLKKLRFLDWFERSGSKKEEVSSSALQGHIIVAGMNSLGRRLVQALCAAGWQVVAVDTDPGKLQGLACHTEIGNVDYRSVLDRVCLCQARLVVSALRIDSTNDLLAYRCREAGVRCAVHVHNLREMDHLLEIGTDYMMIPKVDGVKLQTERLKELGMLPT